MKQKQPTQPIQREGQELLDSLTLHTVDGCGPREAVEELLAVARGSAMILHALFDSLSDKGCETIADGISQSLLLACDQVEFKYFKSPGELAMTRKWPQEFASNPSLEFPGSWIPWKSERSSGGCLRAQGLSRLCRSEIGLTYDTHC